MTHDCPLSPHALKVLDVLTDAPQTAAEIAAQTGLPHSGVYQPLWKLAQHGHAQSICAPQRRAAPCLWWRLRPEGEPSSISISGTTPPQRPAPRRPVLSDAVLKSLTDTPASTAQLAAASGASYDVAYCVLRRLVGEGQAEVKEIPKGGDQMRLLWSRAAPKQPLAPTIEGSLAVLLDGQTVHGVLRLIPRPAPDVAQVRPPDPPSTPSPPSPMFFVTPALLAERRRALIAQGRIKSRPQGVRP